MFGGIKTLTLFLFGGIGGGLETVWRETSRENKSLHLVKGKMEGKGEGAGGKCPWPTKILPKWADWRRERWPPEKSV